MDNNCPCTWVSNLTWMLDGEILFSVFLLFLISSTCWVSCFVIVNSSSNVKQSVQSVGILSRLALHFPRLFSFWGTHNQQQVHTGKECAVTPQKVMESYERDEEPNKNAAHFVDGSFNNHNEQLEPRVSSSSSKLATSRFSLYLRLPQMKRKIVSNFLNKLILLFTFSMLASEWY